jgi:hypothetical protein
MWRVVTRPTCASDFFYLILRWIIWTKFIRGQLPCFDCGELFVVKISAAYCSEVNSFRWTFSIVTCFPVVNCLQWYYCSGLFCDESPLGELFATTYRWTEKREVPISAKNALKFYIASFETTPARKQLQVIRAKQRLLVPLWILNQPPQCHRRSCQFHSNPFFTRQNKSISLS